MHTKKFSSVSLIRSLATGGMGLGLLAQPLGVLASQQPLLGGSVINLSQTVTQHGNIGVISGVNSTANNTYSVASASGTLSKLYVALQTAPGSGASRSFTLEKNLSSTALTCTVSDTATTCTDLADTVSVSAGDVLSWVSAPSNSPASGSLALSVLFTPNTPDTTMLMSRTATAINDSVAYAPVSNGGSTVVWGTTESGAYDIFPDTGTFSSLYYTSNTNPGSGKSYTWALRKNTSSTALTCSVSNTGAGAQACNDTTHTVPVSPGDLVDFSSTPSGTPAVLSTGFGISYTSNLPGSFVFLGSSQSGADSASAARYLTLSGDRATSGTEAITQEVAPIAFTMTKLYVSTTAPGGAASRTFSLRLNGVDTPLTCTITGVGTSCSGSSSVAIAAGDLLSVSDIPAGSPVTGSPILGLTGRITPPTQTGIFGGLMRIIGGSMRFIDRSWNP